MSGCPRAACGQFPGHGSHRGLLWDSCGWELAWRRPVLNAGARWWQAGSHRFRVGLPISGSKSRRGAPGPARLLQAPPRGRLCRPGCTRGRVQAAPARPRTLSRAAASRSFAAAASAGTDPGESWPLNNPLKGLLQPFPSPWTALRALPCCGPPASSPLAFWSAWKWELKEPGAASTGIFLHEF